MVAPNRLNDVWYSTTSNNTINTALALSLTSSGNDYYSSDTVVNLQAGAESYYKFQFTAGEYVIATSSAIGTSCILYNSERAVITTNSNSGTNECRITHTVNTATADFYLQVQGNTASTTGIYQLFIGKNSRIRSNIAKFSTNKNRITAGEEVRLTASVRNNSVFPENNVIIDYFRSSDNIITNWR